MYYTLNCINKKKLVVQFQEFTAEKRNYWRAGCVLYTISVDNSAGPPFTIKLNLFTPFMSSLHGIFVNVLTYYL